MQDSLKGEGDIKLKEGQQWEKKRAQKSETFGEEYPLNRVPKDLTVMVKKRACRKCRGAPGGSASVPEKNQTPVTEILRTFAYELRFR
jgi:hypothetical protein